MTISRRTFLRNSAGITIGAGSVFLAGASNLLGNPVNNKKKLVIIMARGGLDGLTAVPPSDSQQYFDARPNIVVKDPIKITSDFALHPELRSLSRLWSKHKAAIVHATNIPYMGRSHFDGQNLMESGGRVPYKEKTGWLGRGIDEAGLEGISVSLPIPLLLRGKNNSDSYFPSKLKKASDATMALLTEHYKNDANLKRAMDRIQNRPISMTEGMMGKTKNHKNFGFLSNIAGTQMTRENGPQVAIFEVFGFDTHAAQGGRKGLHGEKLSMIDDIFDGLQKSLGDQFKNTLVLTLTEFGRTLRENGGYGSDHGYGTAVLMAGGLIKKAQIYSDWPGLKSTNLFEGRDLLSTIDARSIYCSAMSICFGIEFKRLQKKVFWNEPLTDLTDTLFNA